GYDGYPALQKAIQDMIPNRLTSVQRIDVACSRLSDDNVLSSVLGSDVEKLRRTMDETSKENFDKAVEMICSARKIYILGARSAEALAVFLGYYLKLIFKNVVVIDPSNESDTLAQMMHVDNEACVIGISFPRYCNSAIAALRFAQTKSAHIIAITDSLSSPLAQYAECSLIAKSDMLSIVDSLVAPMSLINALIVAAIKRNQTEVSAIFSQLEEIWDEYDIYQKPEEETP
ncbi:MAG: MurR/RpiR family transcriptional regulator, partial [Clostridia bacterium]|nr:MurR/RpiR family transcriptional regulator [Clostridia bacterium]